MSCDQSSRYFEQIALHDEVKLEADGEEVIKKYVALDLGSSIITSICLTEIDALAKLPLGKYFPQRTYGIVLRKG